MKITTFCCVLLSFLVTDTGSNTVDNAQVSGSVASAHPLATKAGMDILKNGGNAFDAAIAVLP